MSTMLPFSVPSKPSNYIYDSSFRDYQPDCFVIGSTCFFAQSIKYSASGPVYSSSNGKDFSAISYSPPYWDGGGDEYDLIYFNGYVYQYVMAYESLVFGYRRTSDFVTWTAETLIHYNADGYDLMFQPRSFGVVLGTRQYRFLDVGGTSPLSMTYTDDGYTILGTFVPAVSGVRSHYTPIDTIGLVANKVCKIVAYGGYLYSIPYNASTSPSNSVSRSSDGITWTEVTSDWGLPISPVVDCAVTTDGLLVVLQNKQTWVSTDGSTWSLKPYTLPANSLTNGRIVTLGSDLFMIGCGASRNTVFKLIASSSPVGISL